MISSLPRVLEGLRLYMLVFTLPPAFMWSTVPGAGSGALVLAHSCLVILAAMTLDHTMRAAGKLPRLALVSERFRFVDIEPMLEPARYAVILAAFLALFPLLIESVRVTLYALVALIAILTLTAPARGRDAQRRFVLAEIWWPTAALLIPAVLAGLRGWSSAWASPEPDPSLLMPPQVLGATILGACLLAGYIAMCLRRDRVLDDADHWRSSATVLGEPGAAIACVAWTAMSSIIACVGVGLSWWTWPAAAVVATGAAAAAALLGAGRDQPAVVTWFFTAAGVFATILLP